MFLSGNHFVFHYQGNYVAEFLKNPPNLHIFPKINCEFLVSKLSRTIHVSSGDQLASSYCEAIKQQLPRSKVQWKKKIGMAQLIHPSNFF